jgi:hypothetical protein
METRTLELARALQLSDEMQRAPKEKRRRRLGFLRGRTGSPAPAEPCA